MENTDLILENKTWKVEPWKKKIVVIISFFFAFTFG